MPSFVEPLSNFIELAQRPDDTSPVIAAFCSLAQSLFRE